MEKFEDIIKSEKPVLIDFFATWCGPCKMMHPVLEELHEKVGDKARVIKIFRNGELKWRTSGVQPIQTLEQELEKYY